MTFDSFHSVHPLCPSCHFLSWPSLDLKHGKLQLILLAQAEKYSHLDKPQTWVLELQRVNFIWLRIWVFYIPEFFHQCFPGQDSETLSMWLQWFGKMIPQSCIFPRQLVPVLNNRAKKAKYTLILSSGTKLELSTDNNNHILFTLLSSNLIVEHKQPNCSLYLQFSHKHKLMHVVIC